MSFITSEYSSAAPAFQFSEGLTTIDQTYVNELDETFDQFDDSANCLYPGDFFLKGQLRAVQSAVKNQLFAMQLLCNRMEDFKQEADKIVSAADDQANALFQAALARQSAFQKSPPKFEDRNFRLIATEAGNIAPPKRTAAPSLQGSLSTVDVSQDPNKITAPGGVSRAKALKGLWECSKPALFFEMQTDDSILRIQEQDVGQSEEELEEQIRKRPYVDYFAGRCIKVDLEKYPEVDLTRYKEQCGVNKSSSEIRDQCLTKK